MPRLRCPARRPLHCQRPCGSGSQRGFTLIEMMIVVAIIGILSMVAYPSYRDHLVRGQLADATNGLSATRANMERYFQDNRTYASTGSFTTPCAAAVSTRTFGGFVVDCSVTPTATGFTLRAQGSGQVAAFTYTVNEQDVRQTTAAAAGYATCTTQWIVKKGQVCS